MSARTTKAYYAVLNLLFEESDRRAGTLPKSHPYMRELDRACWGLNVLREHIDRLEAKLKGPKHERLASLRPRRRRARKAT